ncbi:MAG: hypothetical protein PF484_12835 [Bacteroidales bacterium]|jgi:hypothetical protein|nr:hypothetical protein [Bacteroidales bacterium]
MEWEDIFKIITGLLVSLGGAGAIILGFSKFIGELFAKRYEQKIRASFQNDINTYQSQLDILKQTTLRYSDKQFELYSILWSSLHDLKVLADELWVEASSRNMERFVRQLKKTKNEIEKASLFIENTHYERLSDTLSQFGNYQIGKLLLVDYRRQNGGDNYEITQMIEHNGHLKSEYEELISEVKQDLKNQIKGQSPVANNV